MTRKIISNIKENNYWTIVVKVENLNNDKFTEYFKYIDESDVNKMDYTMNPGTMEFYSKRG